MEPPNYVTAVDNYNHDSDVPLVEISQSPSCPELTTGHQISREKYTPWRLLTDILCIAWTVPIIFALYVNITNWVVGAGVGCRAVKPSEYCFPDLLGTLGQNRHERLAALNQQDRELLALLQIVSKILETWFSLIATSIVFSGVLYLASRNEGVPLGYLLTHLSSPDVMLLFDFSFWTSCRNTHHRRSPTLRLVAFVIMVVFLCILCNLMGPAIAILIIPQTAWSEMETPTTEQFGEIPINRAPTGETLTPGCSIDMTFLGNFSATCTPRCNPAEIAARNYSCTKMYSASVDELSTGLKYRIELLQRGWTPIPVITEHDGVLFTFNATVTNEGIPILWVPNRQVLEGVIADYIEVQIAQGALSPETSEEMLAAIGRVRNPILFDRYTKALDIMMRRVGPSLGFKSECHRVLKVAEYSASDDKAVRCYTIARGGGIYNVECFRVGSGWGEATAANTSLSIKDNDTIWPGDVSVDIYSTSKAVMMIANSTDLPCGTGSLAASHVNGSCDWNRIFSLMPGERYLDSLVALAVPLQHIVYSQLQPSGRSNTVFCFNIGFLQFPEYVMDLSLDRNELGLVRLQFPSSSPPTPDPLLIDPDWILAAWSASKPGDSIPGLRPHAANLISALRSIGDPLNGPVDAMTLNDPAMSFFSVQHGLVVFQAMTLVRYTTTNVTDSEENNITHPRLRVFKSLWVWKYDNRSRTFRFCAVVSILGCVVAFMRPVVSCIVAMRRPSTLRLVEAALQCREFDPAEPATQERDLGRIPVRVLRHGEDPHAVVLRKVKRGC